MCADSGGRAVAAREHKCRDGVAAECSVRCRKTHLAVNHAADRPQHITGKSALELGHPPPRAGTHRSANRRVIVTTAEHDRTHLRHPARQFRHRAERLPTGHRQIDHHHVRRKTHGLRHQIVGAGAASRSSRAPVCAARAACTRPEDPGCHRPRERGWGPPWALSFPSGESELVPPVRRRRLAAPGV